MSVDTKLMSSQEPPQWWTVHNVAEYRGIHVSTVYNLVTTAKQLKKRGLTSGIPFSQPSMRGHIRFNPEAIRAYFGDEDSEAAPASVRGDERLNRRGAAEGPSAKVAKRGSLGERHDALSPRRMDKIEMIDENANTADLTMNEKLDRILAELADLKAWRAQVSALIECRAKETRPKLDLIIKGLSDMREGDREAAARLDRIESRLETLAMDVVDVRSA